MSPITLSFQDLLLGPIYFFLLLALTNFLKPRLTDAQTARYFIPAFLLKMLGAVAFTFIYEFYYRGGDTTAFYLGSERIWRAITDNLSVGFSMFFLDAGEITGSTARYIANFRFFYAEEEWNMIRITALFGLFCFNTHIVIAMFCSYFSFLGLWVLYRAFLRFFPSFSLEFAIAVFMAPSAVFWGSGIMKDTITLGALGFFFAFAMNVLAFRKLTLFNIIGTIGFALMILNLKSYVLLSFMPALALWGYLKFQASIPNPVLTFLLAPILAVIAGVLGYFLVTNLAQNTDYSSLEEVSQRITVYQIDHSYRAGGAAYSLGAMDLSTPTGILQAAIPAINVTLYRPYPWEAGSPVQLISSFEGIAYFLATLFVVFSAGPIALVRNVLSDPELALCVVFTLILAFAVGITSYNFGALARFKIPILPFFGIALAILFKKPRLRRRYRYMLEMDEIEGSLKKA